MAPARQLAGVLTIGQQARAGVERIFQLLDLKPAIADAPDAVELPALRGEITFDDVHFGYGDGPAVLQGFDLHIGAGRAGGPRRAERERQIDRGHAGVALLRPRPAAPCSSTATTCAR